MCSMPGLESEQQLKVSDRVGKEVAAEERQKWPRAKAVGDSWRGGGSKGQRQQWDTLMVWGRQYNYSTVVVYRNIKAQKWYSLKYCFPKWIANEKLLSITEFTRWSKKENS